VDQLFGGATWSYTAGNRPTLVFEDLSRTLGEADYIEVTSAVTEPSPLFQKFMNDMAAQMCAGAIETDATANEESDRMVVRYPDDVNANLRFLRLKFHSIYIPEDTSETEDGLDEWRQLYENIAADSNTEDAWLGVCIAMITAPEFLTY